MGDNADDNATSDEVLTLDLLANRIGQIKLETTTRLTAMKVELDKLKERVTTANDCNTKRLLRITVMIDSSFDNLQQITTIIGNITDRINECESRNSTMTNSIQINRHNLRELSKYFKRVDKTWKSAIDEIDRLSDDTEAYKSFRKQLILVSGFVIAFLFYLIRTDSVHAFVNGICNFFSCNW